MLRFSPVVELNNNRLVVLYAYICFARIYSEQWWFKYTQYVH